MKEINFSIYIWIINRINSNMDSTDIGVQVFQSIFLQPLSCSKQTISQIVEWNHNLSPSFNMVKGQFKKFVQKSEENAISLCADIRGSLKVLFELQCPKNFIRGYFATIKNILQGEESAAKKTLIKSLGEYEKTWDKVNPELLATYFQTFSLKQKVKQQQINAFIDCMIESKKYNHCLDFIEYLGVADNKANIEKLIGKMTNNKDASKAADFVKRLKLDPKKYPILGERLGKNTSRHFLSKHGWQYAEEIFEETPEVLASIVQDLIYKKKFQQAKSICSRHSIQKYLKKEQSLIFLKSQYQGQIIPNPILSNDIFGPPNEQRYLSLATFGIHEKDVVWVDQDSPCLDDILEDISQAEVLGIDTQSIVGQTKFEKTDQAALIQVSTGKRIYLFDGFKSNLQKIHQTFLKCFSHTKIIGHSFTNDTQGMLRGLGFPENQQVQIKNLIDICKVYKGLNEKSKYSSLAHITKQVFGKQLCKDQTLTNWKRRPLRKNQAHYAALDAHIVVQIYLKWMKQYGEMVHYHAAIDTDD